MKIMKIIEFQLRITKITKNHSIPCENHENYENHRIPLENHKKHENHRIPQDNYANH